MTLITPFGQDADSGKYLEIAEEHFKRTLEELAQILVDLRAREDVDAPSIAKAIADARKATQTVFDERKKIEQLHKSASGVVHDFALDLTGARDEIGRRLACLRAAQDPRDVSE